MTFIAQNLILIAFILSNYVNILNLFSLGINVEFGGQSTLKINELMGLNDFIYWGQTTWGSYG